MDTLAAPPATRPSNPSWLNRAAGVFAACAGPAAGGAMLVIAWQLISLRIPEIPGPWPTLASAIQVFEHPFHRTGPNDVGMGWNILASLGRVAMGFLLAAAVGIPTGFLIGRFKTLNAICSPIISLLRPVSPLAWLPLGLLLFRAANPAAIWAIFICSIWPIIINTADGVRRIPQDYLNVARVLNLSEWKVFKSILLPSVLPYLITGTRLSIGTAWLVIVAAEMLTGGTGIGFWLWDEWNNMNVEHILVAVFVIGVVGMLLDAALLALGRRYSHKEG